MSDPVLLVLGAGPNIGLSVAKAFAAKGYKIALAARSFEDGIDEDGYLRLQIDLTKPEDMRAIFAKVKEALGIPTVVVYNAAARVPRDPKDPLSSISVSDFQAEFAVNAISPFFAAQEAVQGFKQLPESASRTFIETGNKLNVIANPPVIPFGMGKAAGAKMVENASIAYKKQGFNFYYADERQPSGSSTVPVNGPAAGKMYVDLAETKEQGPWNYTFVDGKGYVRFDEEANWAEVRGN